MKVLLLGKASKNIASLVKSLGLPAGRQGFGMVSQNPEVIITYGGDGTLLSSERKYPGIPKLPIRNDSICKKCSNHKTKTVLGKLLKHSLKLKAYQKLETNFAGKTFFALNDFVIRNSDPVHTIRFKTSATDDKLLIGDGIIIATPFGSTGYFKSITDQTFGKGFGVAFNNTTEKILPIFFKEGDSITFKLIRGKATLSFDNSADIFTIDESLELVFKLSKKLAKIYQDTSLRCSNCYITRG